VPKYQGFTLGEFVYRRGGAFAMRGYRRVFAAPRMQNAGDYLAKVAFEVKATLCRSSLSTVSAALVLAVRRGVRTSDCTYSTARTLVISGEGDLESGLPAAAMHQGDRAPIGSGYGLKP
jgi:hypothetical protein